MNRSPAKNEGDWPVEQIQPLRSTSTCETVIVHDGDDRSAGCGVHDAHVACAHAGAVRDTPPGDTGHYDIYHRERPR